MNQSRKYVALSLLLMMLFTLAGCISSGDDSESSPEGEYAGIDVGQIEDAMGEISVSELSDEEITGIRYMREEEKLARDVYLALYDLWGTPIFANIAASEETHTGAVETLIVRYGLEDPYVDDRGTFENETLQGLYTDLVSAGSGSLMAALMVGAQIEELDMVDIASYIESADNADIILVYENLMMGSRNHLRSFVSLLEKEGIEYEPIYLSQGDYDEIVQSGMESNGYMK